MAVESMTRPVSELPAGFDNNNAEKGDQQFYPTNSRTSQKVESDSSLPAGSSENSIDASKDVEEPPRSVKGALWVLIVASILSSTFLFSLDNTIVVSKSKLGQWGGS